MVFYNNKKIKESFLWNFLNALKDFKSLLLYLELEKVVKLIINLNMKLRTYESLTVFFTKVNICFYLKSYIYNKNYFLYGEQNSIIFWDITSFYNQFCKKIWYNIWNKRF